MQGQFRATESGRALPARSRGGGVAPIGGRAADTSTVRATNSTAFRLCHEVYPVAVAYRHGRL